MVCLCLQNPSEAQRKEHDKFDFELHEVYAIDVLISTGEGQGKDRDAKITIYKKTDETYMLKVLYITVCISIIIFCYKIMKRSCLDNSLTCLSKLFR